MHSRLFRRNPSKLIAENNWMRRVHPDIDWHSIVTVACNGNKLFCSVKLWTFMVVINFTYGDIHDQ